MITRRGAYVWIVENNDVLLVQYGPPDGRWSLVGGGMGPRESAEHAALREAREETGFDVELLGGPIEFVEDATDAWWVPFDAKHMTIWWARIIGGTLRPEVDDVAEVEWVPLNDLRMGFRRVTAVVTHMLNTPT